MWILGLLLLFGTSSQGLQPPCAVAADLENCKGGSTSTTGRFQLKGKIVVDKGTTPLVDVRLKDDRGNVLKSVLSFSNGTFRFDDVSLGRYSIEVVDSRYNLATVPLWLRDIEDSAAVITVSLKSNDTGKMSSEVPDLDKTILDLQLDARVPAAALDEFKKGVDGIRERSKDNPPEVHFKKATSLFPEFYEAYYQLGVEQARQHRGAEAIQSLERAATLKRTVSAPLSMLGRLYVEAGQFQNGIDTLLKIGSIGPLSADDRYYLGLAFYKLDNTSAAQQQLELSVSLAPGKNPAAYVQLSNAFARNDNASAALSALEDYLRLFPKDPNHKAVEAGAKRLRESIQKGKP